MSGDWSAYSNYNNTLRAWFVAFGVGVPATFLINKDLIVYISPETGNPTIVIQFFIGVSAQVAMAFINKTINWCDSYRIVTFGDNPYGFWQGITNVISKATNWYLIDFCFDLITIGFFACAMYELFSLILQ